MVALTLINVHVRNEDSGASVTTGEKYRAEAEKNVPQEKRTNAFLLGDFNRVFTDPKHK